MLEYVCFIQKGVISLTDNERRYLITKIDTLNHDIANIEVIKPVLMSSLNALLIGYLSSFADFDSLKGIIASILIVFQGGSIAILLKELVDRISKKEELKRLKNVIMVLIELELEQIDNRILDYDKDLSR